MRFLTRYAIWVAAPLALATGCAGPTFFAKSRQARDVDPTQRMLQIAASYEASGKEDAAVRMYRQLAHMQPNNVEVQQRLAALVDKEAVKAGELLAAPKTSADVDQLLARLRQNKEAYDAGRYGDAQPTLASASDFGAPSAAAVESAEDLAGPWEHASVTAPSSNYAPVVVGAPIPEPNDVNAPAPELAATEPQTVSEDNSEPVWWNELFSEVESREVADLDQGAEEPIVAAPEVDVVVTPGIVIAEETVVVSEAASSAPVNSVWSRTSDHRLCPELKPELQPLVAQLSSPEPRVRVAALAALGQYGTEGASAELAIRVLLEDENPLVRAHAAAALRDVKLDAWDSIKTLRLLVFHPEDEVAQVACYLLGRTGPEAMDAVSELSTLRDSGRGLTSLHAAEALTRIAPHDTTSVEYLMHAAQTGNEEERWFATVAMASTGEPVRTMVVDALTKRLEDDSAEVRAAAALSLGGLGSDAVVAQAALEYAALNDTPEVKDAAATALACLNL